MASSGEAKPDGTASRPRIPYRVGQFLRGLRARVHPDEVMLATGVLPSQALALFQAMPADAQRHSLNVLHALWAAGCTQADLAVAALLHDVGKGAAERSGVRLGLWLRGPLVMAEAFLPAWIRRRAVDDPARGWRYVLYVHLHHAEIGAAWAAQAGCSSLACWLIAHHQDRTAGVPGPAVEAVGGADPAELLAALQWADGRN